MRCPFCQHTESRVLESRSSPSGHSIRRRRECLNCKRRFTTYEQIEFVPVTTIKRDGSREPFDRSKLLRGMVRACEKTGLELTQLEALADEIELQLQQRVMREVTSHEIGELVLSHLQGLSEVAYIRFASVYRKFQGIRDFVDTLNQLAETRSQTDAEATGRGGAEETGGERDGDDGETGRRGAEEQRSRGAEEQRRRGDSPLVPWSPSPLVPPSPRPLVPPSPGPLAPLPEGEMR